MRNLSLVKTLTHLKEERKHSEEVSLESAGLSFTRGTLAEFAGGASTGKTSLALSLLSKLTRAGEVCAVVDSTNSFDPCSAVTSGVERPDVEMAEVVVEAGEPLLRQLM